MVSNSSTAVYKAAIIGLLVVGLNQNLLLGLSAFHQEKKSTPMAASCACPPATCMCPPSNGCEHNSSGNSEIKSKKQITLCHSNDRETNNRFSMDGDVPILTLHSYIITPNPSFTYLNRSPAELLSQQYLTPLDKPPQTFSV